MPKIARPRSPSREPLSRERVLRAAMSVADASGIGGVTMRRVAAELGVEAMSLYRHVANKNEILDGLLELVVAEMVVPAGGVGWREGLSAYAHSARTVLLRHRWAAMLLNSRLTPGPARLHLNEGVFRLLREAGFSIELAFGALLSLDSYIYGFTLQEVWSPFEPEDRSEFLENFKPAISPTDYPYITEAMEFLTTNTTAYSADFEFGLELILDGLERARAER